LTWFVKGHGLGNDYLVLDGRETPFALSPANVRRLCDRRRGVGAGGVLLLMPSDQADFGVRIFHRDGTELETSGDGLRILAYTVYRHGYTDQTEMTLETRGGVVRARLEIDGRKVRSAAVEIGEPAFRSSVIPASGPDRELIAETLTAAGQALRIAAVSVGSPHCVVEVDDVDQVDLPRLGPAIETHPLFPSRTNVEFAQVLDRGSIRIAIWQRGTGRIPASGSGACAAAAVLHRRGRVDRRVEVQMEGGALEVEIAGDGRLTLAGPVVEVCTGQLSGDLTAGLE